jgi:chromosomal replication initiator protein
MWECWQRALMRIREETPRTWDQFFRHLVFKEHSDDVLVVEVPDDFFAQFFSDHYLEVLRDALEGEIGSRPDVSLVVRGCPPESDTADSISINDPGSFMENQPPIAAAFQRASLHQTGHGGPSGTALRTVSVTHATRRSEVHCPPKSITELATEAGLNPAYTFDDFVVGSSNQFSYAACQAVAEVPAQAYNPLFIFGGVGLGKTHLLHAIGIELLSQRDPAAAPPRITYVSTEQFVNEVIEAIRNRTTPALRHKYRTGCDVLLIDDIQFLQGKQSTQEEFFHTFNTLHQAGKQIVLTSDKLPSELPGIEERLRSRIGWGLVTDIQAPTLETRIAIIRKKAESFNVRLDRDVIAFLASSFQSNIRDIEGALLRLKAFSDLFRSPIDLTMARHQLRGLAKEQSARVTMDRILTNVSRYYGLAVGDLTGRRRQRAIAWPRHVAMFLCRSLTPHSLPEIGKAFGGRDHTTVMHAVSKIESAMSADGTLRTDIETIQSSIKEI